MIPMFGVRDGPVLAASFVCANVTSLLGIKEIGTARRDGRIAIKRQPEMNEIIERVTSGINIKLSADTRSQETCSAEKTKLV